MRIARCPSMRPYGKHFPLHAASAAIGRAGDIALQPESARGLRDRLARRPGAGARVYPASWRAARRSRCFARGCGAWQCGAWRLRLCDAGAVLAPWAHTAVLRCVGERGCGQGDRGVPGPESARGRPRHCEAARCGHRGPGATA